MEPLGSERYRILASPGLLDGLAAGDVFDQQSDGTYTIVERSGNLCVQVWHPGVDVRESVEATLLPGAVALRGWLDGRTEGSTVLTFPLSAGFQRIEQLLDDWVDATEGSTWSYGNVYADDGRTPLGWWEDEKFRRQSEFRGRQRVPQRELTLVQRAADDGARAADPADRSSVLDRRDAARGDDAAPVERDGTSQQTEVRAFQQTIAVDGGDLEGGDSLVGKQADGFQCIRSRRRGDPAAADGTTIADVDCDCNTFRPVFVDQSARERRVAESGGADNRTCGPRPEDCSHRVGRSETTRGLDPNLPADSGRNGSNDRHMDGRP